MSIDREFTFLNQSKNSSNNSNDTEFSINRWNNKYSKIVDSLDKYSKCLIPTLMLTVWWICLNENIGKNTTTVKETFQVPDALHVATRTPSQEWLWIKTVISGEFSWEKSWGAPWEKYLGKSLIENTYLMLYRKLSYEEYSKLFSGFTDTKQWDLWDCYLVSTIKSLARSKYFSTLMVTSIQKNEDGSFNLYLPLWSPSWNKIHISKEELSLAKINWSVWYKILEIWFAKDALLKRNWAFLYNWDMPDIKLTSKSLDIITWWSSFYALTVLLWCSNIKRELIESKPENIGLITEKLSNFNPKNWDLIIVSSSRRPQWVPDTQKTYEIEWQSMYYNHSYCLYAVEKIWNRIESVILEDPTNNKEKIKLPIYWFLITIFGITTCSPAEWFLPLI